MTRAEPTLAWIASPEPAGSDRLRPPRGGDAAAVPGWGLGVSTLVHIGLVTLIALAVAPHLAVEQPLLEVEIVQSDAAPPASDSGAPATQEPAPMIEPAPAPPPVESASIAPPPTPPTPPPVPVEDGPAPPPPEPAPPVEARPTPKPEPQPEPRPDPKPEPKAEPKPEPPKPRVRPAPPQVANKPSVPSETTAQPEQTARSRDSALRFNPGVTTSDRNAQLKPLVSPAPTYPRIALQLREEGTVIVSMEIGADGLVTDATVSRTSGFGSLDQAAVQAARGWRFQAPMREGRAVATTVEVPFVFKFKRN